VKRLTPPDLRNCVRDLMAQPIRFPGFPQIIVTRGFAYSWFKAHGWPTGERGFGSLDYMVFAAREVAEPLCDAGERDYWLSCVAENLRREVTT